jgi:hypothetical protein
VDPGPKIFTLLVALGLTAGCEVPTTHLPATRRANADGGTADAKLVPADGRRDSSSDGGCQQNTIDLTVPSADIMLIVDRSAVMNTVNDSACPGCGTYWTTLVDAVQRLTSAKSNQFRWGLKLFPSLSDTDACLLSPLPDVPLTGDASGAIASALASATPKGGAPTGLAVRQVVNYFASIMNGSPKFIVLAMGSSPTCAGGDPSQDDFSASLAEVDRAPELMFVIGVGPDRTKFDQIAMAGAKVAAYSPSDTGYLLGALQGLATSFPSCNFALPSTATPGQTVSVLLDDMPLLLGAPNGFLVTSDGSRVILQGPSCFYVGAHTTLTLKVGCDG